MPAAVSVEIWCFYRPKEKVETELPNVSIFAESGPFFRIEKLKSSVVVPSGILAEPAPKQGTHINSACHFH
jgi:hypothetical protein